MDAKTTEAVELLRRLIATPSTSRDESRTADLLFAFLEERGAAPERLHNNVFARSADFDPARPTLLLNSHHDTVRPAASYTRDPFAPTAEGDRLYGLGSNDAGASVVSLARTFLTFREQSLPFNLLLALSAEEECMGEHGMRALLPQLGTIDMALVGEPTGMQAAVGERGLVVLDCEARGKSGHAARNEGINALYIALDDIARLRSFRFDRVSELLGPIGIAVTQIAAGTQHNVVPDSCRFVVDLRTTDAYTNEETVEILRGTLRSQAVPRSTRIRASALNAAHPLARATAATGRMPGSGRRLPAPMVTKIFCTVRGPRASAVTRRLPTPSTSTGPSGGSRARSSAAACSMTPLSRSSSTLTRGTSSVTYRPRGRSSPSRASSTRVTVTPSCRAVATRTPPGRAEQAGAAYNSSAMSVKRMVFPSFSANLPPETLFGPLRTGEVWEK